MKQQTILFLLNLWSIALEAAPWLLLGLIVSGLIKVWLPTRILERWMGGTGFRPVVNAAVLGTPLPFCSCSVIPAAVTLRRAGGSKASTVSFLVATPENGADSIALSYALLGPFMTIARPLAAIFNAILAGSLTLLIGDAARDADAATGETASQECCSVKTTCCTSASANCNKTGVIAKLVAAFRYAADDLLADIVVWLGIGLVLAALVQTIVPPEAMAEWGSGFLAMLAMLLVGVPMYICATASTPVAAAMLAAGVSPGTTLVFLLAGPATNLGTIGVVRQELGNRACFAYLLGTCGGAILAGLLVDWLVSVWGIAVAVQAANQADVIPQWLAVGTLGILLVMTVRHFYGQLRPSKTPVPANQAIHE